MIGFLFLTYDNIVKEDLWEEYLSNAILEKKATILIHPKHPNEIYRQTFFKNFIISETCETKWGDFSIIEAQKLLLEEALKTPSITHCVFVSHNSIPIVPFSYLYKFLLDTANMSIISYGGSNNGDHCKRYDTLTNPIFPRAKFLVQSQWCILSREHAKIVVREHVNIKQIFIRSWVPDEHVYVNYLIHYKDMSCQIINTSTTHVEWEHATPKVYSEISNIYIDELRTNRQFFLRKVRDNTYLDLNYVLRI
jgi:hypothetical protein